MVLGAIATKPSHCDIIHSLRPISIGRRAPGLALEASLQANPGEGWAERIGTFLRVQTGARSLSLREGTDPDAVLSQAEAALAKGDVAAALTALDLLPPEGQAAVVGWRENAVIRQEAATALQALLAASEE